MGGLLSINRRRPNESYHVPHTESCKRQKTTPSSSSIWDEKPRMIPGLPDEISLQILARIPRICYLNMKRVSPSWKAAVTNPEVYKIRKELGTTEDWLYILMSQGDHGDALFWYALDPVSKKWLRLPAIPNVRVESGSGSSNRIADAVKGWLGRKDASDQIMYCSCAIGAVDGCLYMLGGLSRVASLTRVWKYDPISNSWSEANPMSVGRAYCKTAVLNGKLFVVGGVSLGPDDVTRYALTPLQSAEVFDPNTGLWSDIPSMPFSKARALANAILAHSHKPVATGLASYRGKLYVPQSLYRWPGFFDVGGEVYEPETNSWVNMRTGMGGGWPAKKAGTKRSVVVDGDLYALDDSSNVERAKIKVYNHRYDCWSEGDVAMFDFDESYWPCLLAGLLGKLHVVAKDGNGNMAVMRADKRDDLIASSSEDTTESTLTSVPNIWNVIASRNSGSAKPVSCQNLEI